MEYSSEEIKNRLLEEDYPNNEVLLKSVTRQLLSLEGKGKEALINWYEKGEVPKFEIEGINPNYLKNNHNMSKAAIVLVYARLCDDPSAAYLLKKPVIKHTSKKLSSNEQSR